jgi:hypothetical protein
MKLVTGEALRLPPHTCVVTGRSDGELIDFNVTPACNEPPNIAILRPVIEEAARDHCGMAPAVEVEELRTLLKAALQERDELRQTLKDAAEFEELGARLQKAITTQEVPSHA